MFKTEKMKRASLFVVLLVFLAVAIIVTVYTVGAVNKVNADSDLIITTTVIDDTEVTEVRNINTYVNKSRKSNKSIKEKEVLKAIGYAEDEIENINKKDKNSYLSTDVITVYSSYAEVQPNGEITTVAAGDILEESENDVAGNGYMKSSTRVYKNANNDAYRVINKDTGEKAFAGYGYTIETTMTWTKLPAYRIGDLFIHTLNSSNANVYILDSSVCKLIYNDNHGYLTEVTMDKMSYNDANKNKNTVTGVKDAEICVVNLPNGTVSNLRYYGKIEVTTYNTKGSFVYYAAVGHHQLASEPLYAEINGTTINVYPTNAQKSYRHNYLIGVSIE